MARKRRNPFIDSESSIDRAPARSSRTEVDRDASIARQYNDSLSAYDRALNAYATSERTQTHSKPIRVRTSKKARASEEPIAPSSETGLLDLEGIELPPPPTFTKKVNKAEQKRKLQDRKLAAVRRKHAKGSLRKHELTETRRLETSPNAVKALTYCVYDKKKTGNYNSSIKPVTVRGIQHYRLSSKCVDCHNRKSSFVHLKDLDPLIVSGGVVD